MAPSFKGIDLALGESSPSTRCSATGHLASSALPRAPRWVVFCGVLPDEVQRNRQKALAACVGEGGCSEELKNSCPSANRTTVSSCPKKCLLALKHTLLHFPGGKYHGTCQGRGMEGGVLAKERRKKLVVVVLTYGPSVTIPLSGCRPHQNIRL